MLLAKSDSKKAETTVFSLAVGSMLIYWLLGWWAPTGRGFWWAWHIPNHVLPGLTRVWFLFVWAAATSALLGLVLIIRRKPREGKPSTIFLGGLGISAIAGVTEELVWRWLLVLSAPVGLKFFNLITFGLVKWVFVHGFIPVANWATFGALSPQLLTANWNWLAGAAIVSACASFRDQHRYLGPVGWINSWFVGMVMFWLVFHYGLITAIVAHVLYDAVIFTVAAFLSNFRPDDPYGRLASAVLRNIRY